MAVQNVFIAVAKDGSGIIGGVRGQYAYLDVATLNKSMYQALKDRMKRDNKKREEYYDVYAISTEVLKSVGRKVEK